MEKTYSQRIARVFEIINYFLLIPAGIGVLAGLVSLAGAPQYSLLMFVTLLVGMLLFVGYFKHSRGTLSAENVSALWITSAVFNFILLLPWLYYVSTLYQSFGLEADGEIIYLIVNLVIVFVYIKAVTVSLKAYSLEKRKKSVLSINP